jgi:DNA-binding GntR family transcriptional regulator
MKPPPAKTLLKTNLADQAFLAIREDLLSGERFLPGDKISVEDLARRLGVSRSPVWAAIARLEAEGMVEVRPRKGVFFVGFDLARLREIFAVREVLEGMAARLAAGRVDPKALAGLEDSIARQRTLAAQGDIESYTLEANRFHAALTRMSGNDTLSDLVERLWSRITAMCLRRNRDGGDFDDRIDDHVAIVAAVAAGEAETAESLTRTHISRLAATMGRPAG